MNLNPFRNSFNKTSVSNSPSPTMTPRMNQPRTSSPDEHTSESVVQGTPLKLKPKDRYLNDRLVLPGKTLEQPKSRYYHGFGSPRNKNKH